MARLRIDAAQARLSKRTYAVAAEKVDNCSCLVRPIHLRVLDLRVHLNFLTKFIRRILRLVCSRDSLCADHCWFMIAIHLRRQNGFLEMLLL